MDYAGPLEGMYYLVVVDAYSKWPEVIATNRITTNATIVELNKIFSQFGMPEVIVSDNATQFTSAEFTQYCQQNGIQILHSPPYHPHANGQAEHFVDTFKRTLIKLKGEGTVAENIQTFLLSYRQTSHHSTPGRLEEEND